MLPRSPESRFQLKTREIFDYFTIFVEFPLPWSLFHQKIWFLQRNSSKITKKSKISRVFSWKPDSGDLGCIYDFFTILLPKSNFLLKRLWGKGNSSKIIKKSKISRVLAENQILGTLDAFTIFLRFCFQNQIFCWKGFGEKETLAKS